VPAPALTPAPSGLPASDSVLLPGAAVEPRRVREGLAKLVERKWPLVAGAAAVVIIAVLAFLLLREDGSNGLGVTELAVQGDGGIQTHDIVLPADSIAYVTVRPIDDDLDPDIGVVTTRSGSRRLDDYLGRAGFDLDAFEDAFDDYDGPGVGQVVARVDEGGEDDEERLVLTAPFGGRFEIVVAGAGETSGRFELTVQRQALSTPRSADSYIDLLLDEGRVTRFLSDSAEKMLADTAMINLPFKEASGGGSLTLDDSIGIGELLDREGVDSDAFDCLMGSLSDDFGIDLTDPDTLARMPEVGPDDARLQEAIDACAP
jgi:hypothetical protein